jgi:hypothetical protein
MRLANLKCKVQLGKHHKLKSVHRPATSHVAIQVCPGHATSAPQATTGTEVWRSLHLVDIRVCVLSPFPSCSFLMVQSLLSLHALAHPQSTFTAITISTRLKHARGQPHAQQYRRLPSPDHRSPPTTPYQKIRQQVKTALALAFEGPKVRAILSLRGHHNPKSQTSPFDHPGHLRCVLPLKPWFWFPVLGL